MHVHASDSQQPNAFRLGVVVGTIGSVVYSSFALEACFRARLSELCLAGRPSAFLFRAGAIAAGCGLLVLAAVLVRRLSARCPRGLRCVAMALTAAASITGALRPVASAAPVCPAADSADLGQRFRLVNRLSHKHRRTRRDGDRHGGHRIPPARPGRSAGSERPRHRGLRATCATAAALLATAGSPATVADAATPASSGPDCTVVRCVALTFDDGPTQYTPSILHLLEAHHAVATFFVIGPHALQRPAIVRREQHDGDAIGDHTVTHPHLTALSSARIRLELDGAANDVVSVVGRRPTLLRPPFGAYNTRVSRVAGQTGLAVIMWSLDPQDWKKITPQAIERRVINRMRPGDIVSLHDRYARTPKALTLILTDLANRGYTFVTIPQLLASSGGTRPGLVYHHGPRR